MMLTSLTKFRDFGLLLFRLGFGLSFAVAYGWPKLSGGPAAWAKVGGAMKLLGIGFAPAAWGFLAAFSECFGALLFAVGFLFRPACALLCFTMAVAVLVNLNGEGFPKAWQAIHYALIFFWPSFSSGRESIPSTRTDTIPFARRTQPVHLRGRGGAAR